MSFPAKKTRYSFASVPKAVAHWKRNVILQLQTSWRSRTVPTFVCQTLVLQLELDLQVFEECSEPSILNKLIKSEFWDTVLQTMKNFQKHNMSFFLFIQCSAEPYQERTNVWNQHCQTYQPSSWLQPRGKHDWSVGLHPQWFPAGCKENEVVHLNMEATTKLSSRVRQGAKLGQRTGGKGRSEAETNWARRLRTLTAKEEAERRGENRELDWFKKVSPRVIQRKNNGRKGRRTQIFCDEVIGRDWIWWPESVGTQGVEDQEQVMGKNRRSEG